MNRSSSDQRVPLTVRAADEATEVFITDGRLRRVASGVGELSIDVKPGIYKVRFRSGSAQRDELLEVLPGEEEKWVQGEPVEFRSAVPIEHTGSTREYHARPAEAESRRPALNRGSGSHLFVFVRDLEETSEAEPWVGVTVNTIEGDLIARFEDGGRMDASHRFGALHLELDPGTYRLRVDTGVVGTYEMFVVTSPGWQTQVFTISEDFWAGESRVRRPSLRSASVFMSKAEDGFQHDAKWTRLTELARQGLASGRNVVRTKDLDAMLWEKYQNPMLGIYGAHLMLLQHRIDHRLIGVVMRNLTRLLGDHPDVLSLHLRPGAPTPPKELSFWSPPMLRDSWELISRASLRRRALVPLGSPSDRFADDLISSRPWLLHRLADADRHDVVQTGLSHPHTHKQVSLTVAQEMLDTLVARAVDSTSEVVTGVTPRPSMTALSGSLSGLEQSILSAALSQASLKRRMMTKAHSERIESADEPLRPFNLSIGELARGLDAPTGSIARSMGSLVQKLEVLDDKAGS